MSKNKLAKFADMAEYPNVLQYTFEQVADGGFPLRGRWGADYFRNDGPIVLELGCGRGEYTVGLARAGRHKNYIGIDIKGARMWTGATEALAEGLTNVAFLRTHIELLTYFFAPGEVSEIWITFPDPQMKKVNKRLTSTRFMQRYAEVMGPGGLIHLKCDSNFLFTYTEAMVEANALPIVARTRDLYHETWAGQPEPDASADRAQLTAIRTAYERQWMARGIDIKYLCFRLTPPAAWTEPDVEIPLDTYRSYGRDKNSSLDTHI